MRQSLCLVLLLSCGESEAPSPDDSTPVLVRPGDRSAAQPHFDRALAVMRGEGGDGVALEALDAAIEKDPAFVDARSMRASLRAREGSFFDPSGAIEDLEVARSLRPDDPRLMNFEAMLRYQLGESERAAELAERYLETNPGPGANASLASAHSVLGNVALHDQKLDEAERHFREADRQTPHRPELLFGLAQVFLAKDDLSTARDLLDRARSLQPDLLAARWARYRVLRRLGATQEADRELRVCDALRELSDSTVVGGAEDRVRRAALWQTLANLEPVPVFLRQHAMATFQVGDFEGLRASTQQLAEDPNATFEPLSWLAIACAGLQDEETLTSTLDRIEHLVPHPSREQMQKLQRDMNRARTKPR